MFKDFPPLHPALVHFPIVLLLLAGVFGILSLFSKREFWKNLAVKSLVGGVIFFPLVVITGLIEEQNLEHNEAIHELLLIHKYLGTSALFYYQIVLLWYWLRKKIVGNKEYITWVLTLFLGSLLMGYQGYLGGEMVFKYGAGVKAMETGMKETGGHDHGMENMDMNDSSKTNEEHKDDGHRHENSSMKDMDNMKSTDNMKDMKGMNKKDMKGMDNMKDMKGMNKKDTKGMDNMKDMKGMGNMKDTGNMKDMKGMDTMKNMKGMDKMKGMKLIDNSKPVDNNPAIKIENQKQQ